MTLSDISGKLPVTAAVVALITLFSISGCDSQLPPEELLARGRTALEAGDFDAAGIDAKAALQQDPRSAAGRRLLGDVAMARAAYADAAAEYEKALSFERDPELLADYVIALSEGRQYRELLDEALDGRFEGLENNAVVVAGLALAEGATGNTAKAGEYMARALRNTADDSFVRMVEVLYLANVEGDLETARERAEALVTDYPEYASGHSALATVASLQRDSEGTIAALRDATRLNPLRLPDRLSLLSSLISSAMMEDAKAEADSLAKLVPSNPLLRYFQGRIALADGRIDEGLERMDQVLSDIPNHPGALYFGGLANLEQGNLATAERQLTAFLSTSPDHLEARLAMGRIYLQNSEAERAEQMARNILKDFQGNVAAWRILAASLSLQGMHADSAEIYGQLAASAQEPDVATQVLYGKELVRSGNEAGIPELEKARDLDPANEEARRLLVASYLAKGDPERAGDEAEAYLAVAPESAVPHVLVGQVALWEGDKTAAAAAFDEALAIDPKSRDAIRGKAGLALRDGNTEAAAQVFEEALEETPDSLEALLSLANLQERQGQTDAMAATLRRAVDTHPDALAPRIALARYEVANGGYAEGVALLTEVRDEYPESPDLQELLAVGFLGLGEMDSAVAAAEKLLALAPDNPRALRVLAVTAQADGQFEKAERSIKRSIEVDPDDAQSRRTLVELYLQQQKYDDLAALLASYPEEVKAKRDVKLARGRVELMRGDAQSALGFLRDAHAERADSISVFLLVSALMNVGDTAAGEKVADDWLADNPDDEAILKQYSTYLLANGRDKRGAELLERVYAKRQDDLVVLNNLAWAYRSTNTDRALKLIDEALVLAPDNMSAIDTRSVVLQEAGRYEEALAANDRALKLAPGFPQLLFHRAKILLDLGRSQEAMTALEKIMNADFAEKPEAERLLADLRTR